MKSISERRRFVQNSKLSYKVLLPSLAFVVVFIAFPMVYTISIAFKGYRYGVPTGKPIWFKNFASIFTSPILAPEFYNSLLVTFEFAVLAIFLVVVISLAIALLLNQRFRGNGFVKVALLMPYAIPGITGAVIWRWIYDPTFGILNYVLLKMGIIKQYVSFAADPHLALFAIVFAYVWKFVPYSTFLFTAGLATIPPSVYEAARMDHSGTFNTFRKVTLPLLMPVVQLVLVIQTIFAMVYHFSLLFVITRGGPGTATRTLAWLVYKESFSFDHFGQGAALAIVLSLIMLLFIYIYLVVLNPERGEQQGAAEIQGESHV